MTEKPVLPNRMSRNRIRSNPIWMSQRDFRMGMGRRDQERRQLSRLQLLQSEGVPLYSIPPMIRIDSSTLQKSSQRIGVVGLVVDNHGEGYVTQLRVEQSTLWEISPELPFHQVHIQRLLLSVLGECGLDDGLPELLAFRISDTLGERCQGDSMDIACLLAIVDASTDHAIDLFSAATAVVSPALGDSVEPSKSVSAKLQAFKREYGRGSLLVRHADDEDAAKFDGNFDQVWTVRNLTQLTSLLSSAELTTPLLNQVPLRADHAFAIASRVHQLLANESTFDEAEDFLRRLKRRTNEETPLRIQLEIHLAEEDLHRHRGAFDEAIAAREARIELEQNPLVSCYERAADSDNRHAAALYDAHRFETATACLLPWLEKFDNDPKVCLPETRAKLLNTLARCFVVMGDDRWESLFEQSLLIQKMVDPGNVPITTNYLAHGYLKRNRVEDAKRVLDVQGKQSDAFRIWLAAECARQSGETWNDSQCQSLDSINETSHVCGFVCQAIARQPGCSIDTRLKFLERACRSFEHGLDHDVSNVKRVLSACCRLAMAVSTENLSALKQSIQDFRHLSAKEGFHAIRVWYGPYIDAIERERSWSAVDALFSRVPHL